MAPGRLPMPPITIAVKPFSPAEFMARVRVQLRRARKAMVPGEDDVVHLGDLTIDPGARIVRRAHEEIHLTPTEWALLRTFLKNAGKTLTHQNLFSSVWAASSWKS